MNTILVVLTLTALILGFVTVFSSSTASAFNYVPVTFLEVSAGPLPPGSILAGGYATVRSGSIGTIQVPGCVDGDMSSFPIQQITIAENRKGNPGPLTDVIIISQTEPLHKNTHLQLFTTTQCVSGDVLYDKIEAATTK